MISGHGNDIYNYPDMKCDFSSNIPYRNASGKIADYLRSKMDRIYNYPDPNAGRLTLQLAGFHQVSTDNILVTNGSAEAFYLLGHLFQHRRSVITYPSFSEYEDACRSFGHDISFVEMKSLQAISYFESDTVWFGVPNNPDGIIVTNETISRFCIENPRTSFIVDTAYDELCPRSESVKELQGRFKNLITVHSLTKTFGIPGLRLGYIIADKQVIDRIRTIRPPWSVNAPALEAGSFIMENRDELLPDVTSLSAESMQLQQELAALPSLKVTFSPCNFFLVKMKERAAAELKQFLIDQFGLLIRDATNFRGLTPQHFRISVQGDAWNQQLSKALHLFLTQ